MAHRFLHPFISRGKLPMNILLLKSLASLVFLAPVVLAAASSDSARAARLTVVFNNEVADSTLAGGWGFACLIQGYDKTILFDTGANGDILLANMHSQGHDPHSVQIVALSHEHGDHTDGLAGFLAANPEVEVFLPGAFPENIKGIAAKAGKVNLVRGPAGICPGVSTTGELGEKIIEQALCLRTPRGLVVLTGCAHPGIEKIVAAAKEQTGEEIYLVGGGFHLGEATPAEIERIIGNLKSLGVRKVAPTHCTGDKAVAAFRAAWGGDFLQLDLGSRLTIE